MKDKDMNILTEQEQLHLRESGRQPIIEIEGHPFFVDMHWGLLRPKDDFSTLGIAFGQIDHCRIDDSSYWITYDPKTHSFRDPDYENMIAIPKDIIVVEIPCQQRLDPVGYARKYGLDRDAILKETPLQMTMKARTVPWEETQVKQIIAGNLRKGLKEKAETTRRKRGRKL